MSWPLWKATTPVRFSRMSALLSTPHLVETLPISPLLLKARRMNLGLEGLDRLAIQRGCDYYDKGESLPIATIDYAQFSNAELAVVLLSPSLPPTARTIRLAAALVG